MLKSIKKYCETIFLSTSENKLSKQQKTTELAAAVLMIEISMADEHIDEKELLTIHKQLSKTFNLSKEEVDSLMKTAKNEVEHTVSLHEFIRLLNSKLSLKEKTKIIESLWLIVYSDSVLDKYEEYHLRKISELLYVPHSTYIKAKLKSLEQSTIQIKQ